MRAVTIRAERLVSSEDGARLTVSLAAVAENYARLKAAAPGADLAPVVKADAYGHGLPALVPMLFELGARRFFVARLREGEALSARLGREADIYVLDGCPPGAEARLGAAGLRPVLNSLEQWERWRYGGGRLEQAALHVDTGMNRLGLRPAEAESLARTARTPPRLVMSHLACSTDPNHPMNARQRAAFEAVRAAFPETPASLANTDGIYLGPSFHFDLVRPGLGLYGGGPFGAPLAGLRAAATLEAPILQVRTVPQGETVGYGAAFTAPRALRVAIIAAGYADGVLRPSAGGGYGWLLGGLRPFLGRISMDLLALDVTDCPGARPGQLVELFGPNLPAQAAAAAAGLTAYDLFARSDRRRRVLDDSAP